MLTTKRPTPTTVSYTVSTRSQRGTLTSQLTTGLLLILRLTAGLLVIYTLLLELHSLTAGTAYALLPASIPNTILPSSSSRHPTENPFPFPLPFPPLVRACAYVLTLWLVFRKGYTSESLLVIRGLGVQTATAGTSFLWGGSTRFIAASAVQDVFIHEAFRGFEVRFYLCIVVEGEEGVVVVFPVSGDGLFFLFFCFVLFFWDYNYNCGIRCGNPC